MFPDSNPFETVPFLLRVERFYAGMMAVAASSPEPTLGGKLLLAGELDADGRALVIAANIAGAASLAAIADATLQKQAIRDGVVDFLVTSLDEALRILKNEIRKREPVAVCVAADPETVQEEMLERGVLPDLLRPANPGRGPSPFSGQGAQSIFPTPMDEHGALLAWHVAVSPAQSLPRLDAIAQECLPVEAASARRWLRLAPRYLGRLARGSRLLVCHPDVPAEFIERARRCVEAREIPVPVEIQVTRSGTNDQICLVRKGL